MTAKRGTAAGARDSRLHKPFTRAQVSACATAFGVLAVVATQMPAVAGETSNPAHAIAERFAGTTGGDTQSKTSPTRPAPAKPAQSDSAKADAERRAAEQQRAYEEDMLARARAEAETRLKADMASEQDAARERAAAETKARDDELKTRLKDAEAEAQRRAVEAKSRADDDERRRAATESLSRQREQEARTLAERLRAARRAREEERARSAAETTAKAELEAREARARASLRQHTERLAGRIATMKTEREHAAAELERTLTTGSNSHAGMPTVEFERHATNSEGNHVTVLIVMKPGNRGIRRWNKTADPMLCIEGTCYIGNGPDRPARRISRRKAFGPGVALGDRAGACNNMLACVFRDVDMKSDTAWMQPIDLRIMRHDRREARRVAADPTCGFQFGRLTCRQTVEAADYRAWIIPEDLARAAGPVALHAALEGGLSGKEMAHSREH